VLAFGMMRELQPYVILPEYNGLPECDIMELDFHHVVLIEMFVVDKSALSKS
jgi:hypothetical protein